MTLEQVRYRGFAEASLYLACEHNPLEIDTFALSSTDDSSTLRLATTGSAHVAELARTRSGGVAVEVNCDVKFDSVIVGCDLLGSTANGSAAAKLLVRFFDLSGLQPPQFDRNRFVFRPKI